uniref:Uncharacterized protein n=1 Tax=Salarias fasciatus TaxID=181472 RepID=A0A672FY25_SALFA
MAACSLPPDSAESPRLELEPDRPDPDPDPDPGPGPRPGPGPVSPATETETKLLTCISGLSRQIAQIEARLDEKVERILAASEVRLRLLDRITVLEAKLSSFSGGHGLKRKRRAHSPRIAETVRRIHNSEGNVLLYAPEQSLGSRHNVAVTSHLMKTMVAMPDFQKVDSDVILSACKTYFETLRRSFRLSHPDMADQKHAMQSAARNRQRRQRLLDARKTVLAPEEMELWEAVTIDMMSDEEDGSIDGVRGWIVRPPSFRSQELSDLCAALQTRLEADGKYTALHHRRLLGGQLSDRTKPIKYDSEAAKRHFKPECAP